MIQGKWFAPGEDLSAHVLPVRKAVFGLSGDSTDPEGWNALVFLTGIPLLQAGSGGRRMRSGWVASEYFRNTAVSVSEIWFCVCCF